MTLENFGNVKSMWVINLPITPIIESRGMQVFMTNGRAPGGRSKVVGTTMCDGRLEADMGATLGEVVLSDAISSITW